MYCCICNRQRNRVKVFIPKLRDRISTFEDEIVSMSQWGKWLFVDVQFEWMTIYQCLPKLAFILQSIHSAMTHVLLDWCNKVNIVLMDNEGQTNQLLCYISLLPQTTLYLGCKLIRIWYHNSDNICNEEWQILLKLIKLLEL